MRLSRKGFVMKNQTVTPNLNDIEETRTERSSSAAELERLKASVGGRLRMARKAANRTVTAMADLTGFSPATIKRYEAETHAPAADYIHKTAELCGVSESWISDGTGDFMPGGSLVGISRVKRAGREPVTPLIASDSAPQALYPKASDPSRQWTAGWTVSLDLLTQICKAVAQWEDDIKAKTRISPAKRAEVIAVAYAHFEGKQFEAREMARLLRLVA